MEAVMEEAAGDLGGDMDEEVEMIEEDMDDDDETAIGARMDNLGDAKASGDPHPKQTDADGREIYRGVPYGDQNKKRPGEGDGAGTVAENLIQELRKMA